MKLHKLKRYSKKMSYSYSFGAIPTLELFKHRRDQLVQVVFNSEGAGGDDYEKVLGLCVKEEVPYDMNEKAVKKISTKGNTFVIGVFDKYASPLGEDSNHVVLEEPRNPGNVGAVIRSMVGFGYKDLVLTGDSVDIFNPALISGTMGAFFQMNFLSLPLLGEYSRVPFGERTNYLFLKGGGKTLGDFEFPSPHTLVFGNESKGLSREYKDRPEAVSIPHSDDIESLNLSVSVSLALWEASKGKGG